MPQLPPAYKQRLYRWGKDIFRVGRRLAAYPCRPFEIYLVAHDSGPVAALGLVRVPSVVNGSPLVLAGFGGLVVVPERQQQGIGAALLRAAERMRWGAPGLLGFCEDHLIDYYQRRGFVRLDCPVAIERADGRQEETPQHTIWRACEPPDLVIRTLDVQGRRW